MLPMITAVPGLLDFLRIMDNGLDYHATNFNKIASKLSEHTERCIISFADNYRKTERNMKSIVQEDITGEIMLRIGEKFTEIGDKYNLKIFVLMTVSSHRLLAKA